MDMSYFFKPFDEMQYNVFYVQQPVLGTEKVTQNEITNIQQ